MFYGAKVYIQLQYTGVTKRNACRKCFGSFHMGPLRYNCDMQAALYFSSVTSVCAAVQVGVIPEVASARAYTASLTG